MNLGTISLLKRIITEKIEQKLNKGNVIVLYGPRQCGKTTLLKMLIEKFICLICGLMVVNHTQEFCFEYKASNNIYFI